MVSFVDDALDVPVLQVGAGISRASRKHLQADPKLGSAPQGSRLPEAGFPLWPAFWVPFQLGSEFRVLVRPGH